MAVAKFIAVLALVLLTIVQTDSEHKARISSLCSPKELRILYGSPYRYLTDLFFKAANGRMTLQTYQCPSQCARRSSKTSYHKPCMFFCQKCCTKCLCVPSGYYGNKGECPCYNNWKTKRGGPKCP